eukprot:gene42931-27883_t
MASAAECAAALRDAAAAMAAGQGRGPAGTARGTAPPSPRGAVSGSGACGMASAAECAAALRDAAAAMAAGQGRGPAGTARGTSGGDGGAQHAEQRFAALAALPSPALPLLEACVDVLLHEPAPTPTSPFAIHFAADLLGKAAARDWPALPTPIFQCSSVYSPYRDRVRGLPVECITARGGLDGVPHAACEMLLHLHAVASKLHWRQAG